jgi:phosphoglycerate dehydrogenase-like enzyme
MISVAVLDDYQDVAMSSADWSPLSGLAEVTTFRRHFDREDDLVEAIKDFDVVVGMRERTAFGAALLERLPRLRLLITTGMRNASFDLPAAASRGITVCGTGGTGTPTPELTWGLVLALTRNIAAEDAHIRAGDWQVTMGRGLAGSTIGLLGLGRIGGQVARYAAAFDMTCLAWSANLTAERAEECGARLVTKRQLFEQSGIVSVHLVLSDRTRGLVGAEELRWLGADGLLVNTSRGPIVDEPALVQALHAGTIAGAALDVFDQEPLPPDHPLRTAPRTVLTPHIGYVTRESYRVFFSDVVGDIKAWLDGQPVRQLA